jgi:hypothetical protein
VGRTRADRICEAVINRARRSSPVVLDYVCRAFDNDVAHVPFTGPCDAQCDAREMNAGSLAFFEFWRTSGA